MKYRDPWDSGGTTYFEATGENLTFNGNFFMPDGSASAKYGHQGQWGGEVSYDGISYFQSQTFHTIYPSSGTLAGGASLNGTKWYNSSALSGDLQTQTTSLKRDRFGTNFFYIFGDAWKIDSSFQHEHKDGTLEQSLLFGNGKGATPNSGTAPTTALGNLVYFPQPIDYDTDQFNVTISYTQPVFQAEFGYSLSNFTNNLTSFKAIDPFTSPTTFPTTGTNQLTGAIASYALPPSNMSNQLEGLFAYNVTPETRLNANFSADLMTQNAGYGAATYNANTLTNTLMPKSSFDGMIGDFFGNLAATSNPLPHLDLRASYTMDDRHNFSGRDRYKFYENDALTGAAPNSNFINIPLSVINQTAKLEGGYRVVPSTKLTVGYVYKITDRDFSNVNHNTNNTLSAGVNSTLWQGVTGMLGYEHSVRTASNFNLNAPWQALGNYTSVEGNQVMFYDAPRTADTIRTFVSAMINEQVSASLNGKFAFDHYPAVNNVPTSSTGYGLADDHTLTIGPDVTYAVEQDLSVHFFYNFEEIFQNQSGPGAATTTPANQIWNARTTNQVHTAGISSDWQATDKLKLGADGNFSYGETAYLLGDGVYTATGTGVNYLITQLPNVISQLYSVNIHGEYALTPNVSLWMGYRFERFIYKDATFGYNATLYGNALLPGDSNPSYVEHIVSAQLRIKW